MAENEQISALEQARLLRERRRAKMARGGERLREIAGERPVSTSASTSAGAPAGAPAGAGTPTAPAARKTALATPSNRISMTLDAQDLPDAHSFPDPPVEEIPGLSSVSEHFPAHGGHPSDAEFLKSVFGGNPDVAKFFGGADGLGEVPAAPEAAAPPPSVLPLFILPRLFLLVALFLFWRSTGATASFSPFFLAFETGVQLAWFVYSASQPPVGGWIQTGLGMAQSAGLVSSATARWVTAGTRYIEVLKSIVVDVSLVVVLVGLGL